MRVVKTERGQGEYPFFQMITDKDAGTFVEITGLEGPGVRFAF